MEHIYEGATGTAKRIRPVLKKMFPGVKFSVTSKSYSGGCSVRVRWTDGPRRRQVEKIVHQYETANFDGMQDLKTYNPMLAMNEKGDMVQISGADFIFCERDLSDAYLAKIEAKMVEVFGSCDRNVVDYWRYLNIAERMLSGESIDTAQMPE